MSKLCEKCGIDIPENYINLLCDSCYKQENTKIDPSVIQVIKNPLYKENPEAEDKEQWKTNIDMFYRNGVILWKPTRQMYTFIKDYCLEHIREHPQYLGGKFVWRPKIVDVGCGMGCGSNVMSQEADFVWGIDKNATSIRFAKEAFERVKNNIYYSAQVTFDNINIMEDTRDFLKFDLVVAIEIIEHIADYKKFLEILIKKFDKRKTEYEATVYFLSTPNRNNRSIDDNHPKNAYHVREWTQEEYIEVLSEFFNEVEILNAKGEPVGDKTDHSPILAKCTNPKI